MLRLVHEAKKKKRAQTELERALKDTLKDQGSRNIGFPGGNADHPLYSLGDGKLWAAFGGVSEEAAIPRFWNAFGIYRPSEPAQMIAVEINIPTDSNSAKVAGFFAEDADTGDIYLMHSGKVGGGRPGIGKLAFLVWSKAKLVEVSCPEGGVRKGIAVGRLDDHDLAGRIWAFVKSVQNFKDMAAKGELETPDFKRCIDEYNRYSKEYSGKKNGRWGSEFEYMTYHGDVIQALHDERIACAAKNEGVYNSILIDLFVKKDGVITEVYEVKTGVGRQVLYTAIGQLVTHTATLGDEVTKYLVVPADEAMPEDLERAVAALRIQVRRFKLNGRGRNRTVHLS